MPNVVPPKISNFQMGRCLSNVANILQKFFPVLKKIFLKIENCRNRVLLQFVSHEKGAFFSVLSSPFLLNTVLSASLYHSQKAKKVMQFCPTSQLKWRGPKLFLLPIFFDFLLFPSQLPLSVVVP